MTLEDIARGIGQVVSGAYDTYGNALENISHANFRFTRTTLGKIAYAAVIAALLYGSCTGNGCHPIQAAENYVYRK